MDVVHLSIVVLGINEPLSAFDKVELWKLPIKLSYIVIKTEANGG